MSSSAEASQAVQMAVVAMKPENARGDLAATVNGVPLYLGQVARYFELFRHRNRIGDEEGWAARGEMTGLTAPEMMRQTVEYLVNFMLIEQLIDREGIEVPDEEVNMHLMSADQMFGADGVLASLAMQGISQEDYRQGVRSCLERAHLQDAVLEEPDPTDFEVLTFLRRHNMVPRKTSLPKMSDEELVQGREAYIQYHHNRNFDRWYARERKAADIVIGGIPGNVMDVMMGRDIVPKDGDADKGAEDAV